MSDDVKAALGALKAWKSTFKKMDDGLDIFTDEHLKTIEAHLNRADTQAVDVPAIKNLLESWTDYSILREHIASKKYPNIVNETHAVIDCLTNQPPTQDTPCETCKGDPETCASVLSARHCEKANRGREVGTQDMGDSFLNKLRKSSPWDKPQSGEGAALEALENIYNEISGEELFLEEEFQTIRQALLHNNEEVTTG